MQGSDGEDSGDDQLVSPKRCTAQGSASHRIDVIGNMAAAALGRAQLLKMLAGEQGGPTIDCLHVLLHALQWHLALAMVRLPTRNTCRAPHGAHVQICICRTGKAKSMATTASLNVPAWDQEMFHMPAPSEEHCLSQTMNPIRSRRCPVRPSAF